MADGDDDSAETGGKPRSRALLIGLLLALPFGGGGFYAAHSGMFAGSPVEPVPNHAPGPSIAAPTFVELDPLRISVGGDGSIRQLQFRGALQISGSAGGDVIALSPRILDILATYLRALPLDVLRDPTALLRIRAHMLQRIRLLAGPDAVEDLLIIDFVIT